MNKAKLSALCAKARGYTIIDNLHVKDANGNWVVDGGDYNPSENANQADDLLEYVADGRRWEIARRPADEIRLGLRPYRCIIHEKYSAWAETQNLAKILCALRASPEVTDAEINDAMEE